MLHTDVLFVCFDDEGEVFEPLSDLRKNPTEHRHGVFYNSSYAPDASNRQYALVQKIMMSAELWCSLAEGFEAGMRAWELDVGEWERASGTVLADAVKFTVMMNVASILLGRSLQLGTYANSAALRTALLQWCFYPLKTLEHPRRCQLEMQQVRTMTTGCKSTPSRKGEGRAKANSKTIKELAQATQATQTSTPARTVVARDNG